MLDLSDGPVRLARHDLAHGVGSGWLIKPTGAVVQVLGCNLPVFRQAARLLIVISGGNSSFATRREAASFAVLDGGRRPRLLFSELGPFQHFTVNGCDHHDYMSDEVRRLVGTTRCEGGSVVEGVRAWNLWKASCVRRVFGLSGVRVELLNGKSEWSV